MKKYFLSSIVKKYFLSLLSLVLAIALSSFTKTTKNTELLYWFQIDGQYWPSCAVLKSDANYLMASTFFPEGSGCSGGFYQCVSGFAPYQIDILCDGSYELIDDSQVPLIVAYKKSF